MTGAYKLQRSLVVGADEHIKHNGRTCENAYVQESDVSIEIQKRIFNAIGVPYEPTWSEGLQVCVCVCMCVCVLHLHLYFR